MPMFVAKPALSEARQFVGGPTSTVDIQGWMLANDVESTHNNYERIVFGADNQVLEQGQWVMLKAGQFEIIEANELFGNYSITQ